MPKTIYFAHPISTYCSPEETRALRTIAQQGFDCINPSDAVHQTLCGNDMINWAALAGSCDAVVLLPFWDGKIGAGVVKEVQALVDQGKKVFALTVDGLTMSEVHNWPDGFELLDVEQTRSRIKAFRTGREQRGLQGVPTREEWVANACPDPEQLNHIRSLIQAHLQPDLLKSPYKEKWCAENPTYGFCTVASEAAWFLLGGKEAGWVAHTARDTDKSTHWWLQHASGVVFDPTREQYDCVDSTPPYERGLKCNAGGFMGVRVDPESAWGNGRKPGNRAAKLLEAIGQTGLKLRQSSKLETKPKVK